MNQIVWSDLAYLTYTDISEYLTEKYSLDAALRFDEEVENLLEKLRSFNKFCPPYEKRPVLRKCVINRYSPLLYRIDGNKIHLASFLTIEVFILFDNCDLQHFFQSKHYVM